MRKDLRSAISGPFEQLARAIKGSPDQPRDDHGRWTSTGANADHSKDTFTQDDHAFVAKYGDNFTSALNHLWSDYGISGNGALDIQAEVHAKTPDDLIAWVADNYVGEFDSDEEIAKEWLRVSAANAELDIPHIVAKHIDMDSLGSDLTHTGGPLMKIVDTEASGEHVFKRPTKG